MGNRTRLPDMPVMWRTRAEAAAASAEAERTVERWNRAIRMGRDVWWSPTIRCAIVAGTPWLDVYCPGCNTSRVIDIRKVDRHPLASVGSLVLGVTVHLVSGFGTDAQDHRVARLGAGRASDGRVLMAKSAKPDAAARTAKSLSAREKVALFCAAADIDHAAVGILASVMQSIEIRGLISREHAARPYGRRSRRAARDALGPMMLTTEQRRALAVLADTGRDSAAEAIMAARFGVEVLAGLVHKAVRA